MKWFFLGLSLFSFFSAQALELEYLSQVTLPHRLKFKKTQIGGLSGLTYDSNSGLLSAISDDRGLVNEPRIYEFKISIKAHDLKVEPEKVIFLSVNEGSLAHQSTKSKVQVFSKVLDLEGISRTPWGDFLLVNEGDVNHKPRVNPQILDVKSDGTVLREFTVPDKFLPEKSGRQKKGIQNNLAFEGIAEGPDGKSWLVSTEAPLVQDLNKQFVRLIQYEMLEAWVLKPAKEFLYPLASSALDDKAFLQFQKGISDILSVDTHRFLTMERALSVTGAGLQFQIEIYEADLAPASDVSAIEALPVSLPEKLKPLGKKLLFSLDSLKKSLGGIENFEGMTWGPRLSDGRRTLILVSDDNFMRNLRTQFLLFAVKE